MIRKTSAAVTMLALLVAISPAAATASLTCHADDPSVSLSVQAVIGHAGSVNTIEAEVVVKGRGPDAKAVKLANDHLVQHWATGRDVRLGFFRDDPAYTVDLTLETRGQKDDEQARPGTYRLKFTEAASGKQPTTVNRTGRASCTLG